MKSGVLYNSLRKIYSYVRYVYFRYIKKGYISPYSLCEGVVLKNCSNAQMSFFGYYNISPENTYGDYLFQVWRSDEMIDLFYRSHALEQDIYIDSVSSFNLQQGCMLQWGTVNQSRIYYNKYNREKNIYQTVVFDKINKEKEYIDMPIYAVSKQEDYALSLNFERLAIMRPDYGYFCNKNIVLPSNSDDGIWRIDLGRKSSKLIVSLEDLISIKYSDTMSGAMHKVNHIDISPDGKRFMFLHRWVGPKGRYMRLVTCDNDGSNLRILNGDRMTSHSYWKNSKEIVSFCYTERFGNAYVLFDDQTGDVNKISDNLPTCDGHPSICYNNNWMITDTYPDLSRMSKLLLYNFSNDDLICLGRFYQPMKYRGTQRVDLHPKWNYCGNKIYFESAHSGTRKLYYVDITKFLAAYER